MDDQVQYYKAKLQYEIEPWDLNEALGQGDKILLVDTDRQKPMEEVKFLALPISHIER